MVGPHCTTLGHSNNTICIIPDHCLASTHATSRNQNCFNVVPMYPTLAQQRPSPNILTVSVPSIMVPATIGVTNSPPPWKTLGCTNGCNAGPATAQYWLNIMCLLACPSPPCVVPPSRECDSPPAKYFFNVVPHGTLGLH